VKFGSKGEMLVAAVITVRWLPELVRRVEAGVKALGFTIHRKVMAQCTDGRRDPILILHHPGFRRRRGRGPKAAGEAVPTASERSPAATGPKPGAGAVRPGWEFWLNIQSALADFLTLDRDEDPVRVDVRLTDPAFAEKKLGEVVEGRLAMARAVRESRRVGDLVRNVKKHGAPNTMYRVWECEQEQDGK
jgi:hypothetical protein